jgi:hypothetical protein
MSAGAFTRSSYQTSLQIADTGAGAVCLIRVQPETLSCTVGGVANSAPTGGVTLPLTAVVSRGRRAKGIIPRTVTLVAATTGQPTGYKPGGLTTIPCLNLDFFQACSNATDATTVSYLGSTTWKVSYVSDERVR